MRSPNHGKIGKPVSAFGRCRQAEQLAGFKVLEQPAISARSGMVELVDDDDVEVIRGQVI